MRCQKLRSLLPAYCNDELESSTLVTIERHFQTCPSCRQDLAAHRLICGGVAAVREAAENNSHLEQTTSSMEASEKPMPKSMYHVSKDFNTRLLDRIADERYAEVRSQAHLPRKAPLFGWAQIAPAVVTVSALALVAVGLLSENAPEAPQLAEGYSKALVSSSSPAFDADDIVAPPLGERFGLNEKYMTAQPINNPTLDGVSRARLSKSSALSSGAGLVSSQSGPLSRWQFTRQLERARRIMEISNSLGMGHAYFEVIKYQTRHSSGVMIVRVNPYGTSARQSQPQIIIRPNPLRENDGRSPAGRLVGSF